MRSARTTMFQLPRGTDGSTLSGHHPVVVIHPRDPPWQLWTSGFRNFHLRDVFTAQYSRSEVRYRDITATRIDVGVSDTHQDATYGTKTSLPERPS
jgi:hypothetical protein